MTPEQQVALDAMRSAWPEEVVQRMLRQTKLGVQFLAREWVSGPRRSLVVPSGWLNRDDYETIPDEFFDFTRGHHPISSRQWPWRAVINDAGHRVDGTFSPPETPAGVSTPHPQAPQGETTVICMCTPTFPRDCPPEGIHTWNCPVGTRQRAFYGTPPAPSPSDGPNETTQTRGD